MSVYERIGKRSAYIPLRTVFAYAINEHKGGILGKRRKRRYIPSKPTTPSNSIPPTTYVYVFKTNWYKDEIYIGISRVLTRRIKEHMRRYPSLEIINVSGPYSHNQATTKEQSLIQSAYHDGIPIANIHHMPI